MLDPTTRFVGLTELLGNLRVYVMFLLIQNLQDKMQGRTLFARKKKTKTEKWEL